MAAANAAEITVCPPADSDDSCDHAGDEAIQAAVDSAPAGTRISIRAGVYSPRTFRDVRFGDITVRAAIVVDGKHLELAGTADAVLDGSAASGSSAIAVRNGGLQVRNLSIKDFRVRDAEDDIYDGHGVFVIDSSAALHNVDLIRLPKMSVTVRGGSHVQLSSVRIVDGHVGLWLEETASATLDTVEFRNNDSAGIAAYANSTLAVRRSVFADNLDDGIYVAEHASGCVVGSLFSGNSPYAIRAVDEASIQVSHSRFHRNSAWFNDTAPEGAILRGENLEEGQMDSRPPVTTHVSSSIPACR